jgi:hypothetical protein
VEVDKLVGAEEIAQRLGLKRYQHVHMLRSRHEDFPEPVVRLKRVMIWYWPDVERWAKANDRETFPASPT